MKATVVCVSFIALGLMFIGQSEAKIDPKSFVGFWHFDEGKGNVAKDDSGNGNDGKILGAPKWVDGKIGKGLQFDGQKDYVEVSDIATPPIMTFACWFKRLGKGNGGVPRLHSRGTGPWSIEFGVGNSHQPDQLEVYLAFADGSNTGWQAAFEPKNDTWYHTAFSYDGTFVRLYVDGKEVYSKKDWAGREVNEGISRIGCHDAGGDCFDGLIDEVAIFNVALSPNDVLDLMAGLAVFPAGKLATAWGTIKIQ